VREDLARAIDLGAPRRAQTRLGLGARRADGLTHDRHRHPRLEPHLEDRPVVRSLLDTDFYKLLMCQSVLPQPPDTRVTFQLINRSTRVRLADLLDEGELREQLDHIRTLRLTRGESTWLRGNTFYGKRQMFSPEFMEWFEGLTLPPYHLERRDGQFILTFEGLWPEVMLWEIPALAVIMELRSRAVLRGMGRFELQVLYARAMTRVWEKGARLARLDGLRLADFGTRRRHGYLWQDWCVQAMEEALGPAFIGTSNCLIAKKRDLEAIGTNAHELPWSPPPRRTTRSCRDAPYGAARWQEEHEATSASSCPTTFGPGLPDRAPDWLAPGPASASTRATRWRPRGRDPLVAARQDPRESSDLLRRPRRPEIEASARASRGRVKVSFGWGRC
jgi:nicotinate phosphoribosyltransferase